MTATVTTIRAQNLPTLSTPEKSADPSGFFWPVFTLTHNSPAWIPNPAHQSVENKKLSITVAFSPPRKPLKEDLNGGGGGYTTLKNDNVIVRNRVVEIATTMA